MADEPKSIVEALVDESAEELYEDAPVGYVSSLPDGLLVRVNATLLAWTGFGREELVGHKRLYDLLAPGAKIYYETHYAPLLRLQGKVREIAVEIVCADGRRMPVLLNSTLVTAADGTPRVVRTTVFDASDRRRYERELLRARADAESRARSALALAHVNEGVVLVGRNGDIDAANAAAETILVLGEWLGRPMREVVPEWERIAPHIPVGGPGERTTPATLPLVRAGRERWLELAGVDSGEGIVYTIRDVTAEHELEQLRHDLITIVSHELRTPLTGALGAAQTLQARYDDLDDGHRRLMLDLIVGQGDRLRQILDQVLLASQLDTGALAVDAGTFDAADLVRRLPDGLASDAARSRLVLDADRPLRAVGDPGRVAQVLVNLVDNALKYSHGSVRLVAAGEGSTVRFMVSDEGPGIPASEHDRVFDRFHRLDPTLKRGVGGTGLGLYIARELVTRMNGRIGFLPVTSGTAVYVDLPAAP